MKNILMFSHEFPPYIGGVGSVGYQIAKWLSDKGYNVTVLTRYEDEIEFIDGINFKVVKVLPKLWFLSYARYLKNINLNTYDAIILNECAPTIVAGKYFKNDVLKKCIVYLHGLEVENIYSSKIKNVFRWIFGFRSAHIRTVNNAKKVVAVGEHMKNKFISCAGVKLCRDIDVVYAGLDTDKFKISNASINKSSDFVLVSASRVIREKGYFEKLEIFKRLKEHYNVHWIICGDGKDLNQLKESVESYGLRDAVTFKGFCNRDLLKKVYAEADLFWLLSNYDEALPLCYIEAQLCGVPTIGRNIGGTKEAILDNINGFLVDNEELCYRTISTYIDSDKRLERSSVRDSALYFDIDATLSKLENFL